MGRAAIRENGIAVPIAAGGPSGLRSWVIIWPDAGVEAVVGQAGLRSRCQRVPFPIKIWSVVVRRKPVNHSAGQPIHLIICPFEQVGTVISDVVELGEPHLQIPAQCSLESSLGTGPTSGVTQDINPT